MILAIVTIKRIDVSGRSKQLIIKRYEIDGKAPLVSTFDLVK